MATAFTGQERESIRMKLRQGAHHYAATLGMRQTTVDELAHYAGISKGTFYLFYPSKEHLFLAMLEDLHARMYGAAKEIIHQHTALPPKERAITALRQVCRVMAESGLTRFTQEELPFMLKRLPKEIVTKHYHSDDEHIRQMVIDSGLELRVELDTACAVLRLLLMSLRFQWEIGTGFPQALDLIINGICQAAIV